MKKILYLPFVSCFALCLSSCIKDQTQGNIYVNPIELHLTYDIFANSEPLSTPFTLQFSNISEQITQIFTTDLWGHITLNELLPGEYTISVTGSLTPQEVERITGQATDKGYNLGGFLSGIKLGLNQDYALSIPIIGQLPSKLIFKELYYAGSRTPSGGTYRNDGFFSIYNNSNRFVSLNNIYIASIENFGSIGATGPLWPGETPGNYLNVYAQVIWKIVPDDTPVTVAPGQTIVIATMAAPHNQDPMLNITSPVNLSASDYEAYIVDPINKYTDYPAPNMKLEFWPSYSSLWRLSVFGQGMVLIEASDQEMKAFETVSLPEEFQDPFEQLEFWLCKKIPNSYIIDAVDLIQNNTVTNTKRFHYSLDSGFATVGGTYLGKSVIRKEAEVIDGITYYQDTNNSTEDFQINDTPLSH